MAKEEEEKVEEKGKRRQFTRTEAETKGRITTEEESERGGWHNAGGGEHNIGRGGRGGNEDEGVV